MPLASRSKPYEPWPHGFKYLRLISLHLEGRFREACVTGRVTPTTVTAVDVDNVATQKPRADAYAVNVPRDRLFVASQNLLALPVFGDQPE